MTQWAISVDSLSKSFGREHVLQDINLTVEKGEFCVIIGPSGCGKSTLLKCIAGLLDFEIGEVMLDGTNVRDISVKDANIGFVFQEFEDTLFPHKTVRENVAFGLQQQPSVTTTEVEERVNEILGLLAISETTDNLPTELSGGQQQRVELARQLVRECEIVLLDDPLADLDYKLQKQMELDLRRIHSESDSTFVYVTHNQEQALKLGDRLVVMNRGQIEQTGTPFEVYEQPKTAFVGRFVGDSNVLRGEVLGTDGDVVTVETEIGTITATAQTNSDHLSESVVLIRPENIDLGSEAEELDTTIEATLEGRTYTGEITEFTVRVPATDGSTIAFEVMQSGESMIGEVGSEIRIGWDISDAIYFNRLSVTEAVTIEDIEEI
ncbi:ABC transporter ATP-binding protein [Halorussus salinisoli]|uniref:ABC transporter ATP-binding protein n=1 Tax=Halorussus salinisoli TaxID=2558242 RepID=UPI0010C1731B|nr:ABC transporter ATP-binding protein [Halorussus salinisoli]